MKILIFILTIIFFASCNKLNKNNNVKIDNKKAVSTYLLKRAQEDINKKQKKSFLMLNSMVM
jgi:thioredoxin-related protein